MSTPKKIKSEKTRNKNYEKKLAVNASFQQLIGLTVGDKKLLIAQVKK